MCVTRSLREKKNIRIFTIEMHSRQKNEPETEPEQEWEGEGEKRSDALNLG